MLALPRCFTYILLIIGISMQLSGCVAAVVGAAAGSGAVAIDRRTAGIYIEDENVEIKVSQQIRKILNNQAHINVTSYNLNVLLTGEVPTAKAKEQAEHIAKSIKNIKSIANELTIGPKSTIGSRANDSYITSKVKSKFVAEKGFPAIIVKIVTEASTVYLMGIVNNREADLATEIARTTTGVEKVVKVFEYQH